MGEHMPEELALLLASQRIVLSLYLPDFFLFVDTSSDLTGLLHVTANAELKMKCKLTNHTQTPNKKVYQPRFGVPDEEKKKFSRSVWTRS